jgi:hypothetical protein
VVIIKLTHMPEKSNGSIDVVALREGFEAEVRRQLGALGITGGFEITGRRSITVGGRRVIGFSMRVGGLDADQSLRLQIEGIGGKRTMGGGVFRRTRGKAQGLPPAEPTA